jgi:hypothetical protein
MLDGVRREEPAETGKGHIMGAVRGSSGRAGGRGLVAWVKSAYSVHGNCVEVIAAGGGVAVRDSKVPDGPLLWFTRAEWTAFLDGAKDGQFDRFTEGA